MTRRTDDLEKMRTSLLAALGAVSPADRPRITKELRAVNAELEALVPSANPDTERLDELKERRAVRRSAAQG